ncbi:MAG: hypothetical protein GTN62_02490 [Gemmatimonadales bacterium]|nr:hypothetical protein [Gemmatimonadales bacterium]NIN10213.1 hypothetical protein [Gemmatimonadales bacterium]NIN48969.1 hypothetical protein [Gemmatimonadales bacterium]NIP06433.1 hypothetical protein [Gemmatimonadales bacterium]NIQ98785.1 hypothetical protein [Gemmatimonadales bacterium]
MRRLPTLVILGSLALTARAALAQDLTVREWLIRGPIPADTGRSGVLRDYLAEAVLLPDVGDTAAGGAFERVAADSLGGVDLNSVFTGSTDWSAAYAHTYVFSPTERTVGLVMDSDDDLVARVNGQRVWVHVVPRGLGSGRDTVSVRFARGWNSVLLKVINRTGGFGLRCRLTSAPGEATDDLKLSTGRPPEKTGHIYPTPTVVAAPLRLATPLRWSGDGLRGTATLPVTAWGPDTLRAVRLELYQGGQKWLQASFDALPPGEPERVHLAASFEQLRRASLGQEPVRVSLEWRGGSRGDSLFVDADPLLRLLTARLALADVRIDSTEQRVTLLDAALTVPAALDGFTVDLLTRGLGPDARYDINDGRGVWEDGIVQLCSPCREGEVLRLTIRPDGSRPLWARPMARIRQPGYAEFADGYDYARALTGSVPPIERPDARQWLRLIGESGDAYQRLLRAYDDAYAPLAAEIRRDTFHLVGNSHIDAAWLWRWQETIDVIRNTWRSSLKLADIFPGYRFAASSAAFYDAMDHLEPSLADSLRRAEESGLWSAVGGWWVEPDLNVPAGESLVRQGLYGQHYFQRRYGHRSKIAWTPDTFGYPWTVPQILRRSGFDAFVTQKIRWNDSTEFPHDAFYWEGRDGTQIFSYNPYGYVSDLAPARLVRERLANRERQGGHHQMVLYGVGDHGGGPTIAMLQRAENLRRIPTFPAMRYAGPGEALEAVRRSEPPEGFPVWRDEMYLEYHRGTYTTHAAIKRRNRLSEVMLQTAEALAVLDTAPYPRDQLGRAWRHVLFNQFHDILPGSGIDSIYTDAHAMYDTAWAAIDSVTAASFASLRRRMDTRGAGQAVVVFNPLGWTRSGQVTVPVAKGDSVLVTAHDVPPLGALILRVPRDTLSQQERRLPAPTAGANWIENAHLRVEIDTVTGAITRLYDKANHREVLAPDSPGIVLQIFDDRPQQWDAWNIVLTGERWVVDDIRRTGGKADGRSARFDIEREWGNSNFRQRLVLGRDSRYLDVLNEVDWHERRKLLKVALPLDVAADSATYEIPYGTIGRSGNPRTQAERAKFEVPGQRWADVSQGDYGVTIMNDSKYGWDYRNNVLRLSLLRSPIWPDSTADRGMHRFRFAIYPHAGDWREAQTVRLAAEYNVPLLGGVEPPHRGALGKRVSLAAAEPANVQIDWVKRAEDSDHLVLRLVEWHGEPADAAVTTACDIARAHRANLLEDLEEPLTTRGRRLHLALHPYEIATVVVECAQ